ncbi:MAG: hypothetical protein KatS3mg115_0784 [Candidatus Poribacteria bacterium]|nr:MAG: hypothetical protein KatS3mg115_0784 [Candidatus Poribacteria bacterium]
MRWHRVGPQDPYRYRWGRFTGRRAPEPPRRREALRRLALRTAFFGVAYQLTGETKRAEALYLRSLRIAPTPEAYTFLGWLHASQGHLATAIQDCKRAIRLDPEFGNPYNDIGTYLTAMGRFQEAIPWFHKALRAKRYRGLQFPYLNLGRVYELQMDWKKAQRMFETAVRVAPDFLPARLALRRILSRLN